MLTYTFDDLRSDNVVNILDCVEDGLSMVLGLVSITHLQGLMYTSGGPRGHSSTEKTFLGVKVNFHSGVTTGIKNAAGEDLSDGHLGGCAMDPVNTTAYENTARN